MQPLERRQFDGESPVAEPAEPPRRLWRYRLGVLLFMLVTFEVGLFLLFFPWMQRWDTNSIGSLTPWIHDVWVSPYFKGALSGVGVVNIYISFAEVVRLRWPRADRLKVTIL